MVKLYRTELTATGRPVLLNGEVERGMLDKIDLHFYGVGGVEEHSSEEYKEGYVVLTNYRLIWLVSSKSAAHEGGAAAAAGVPCHLPLPAVAAVEHKPGMLIKHARVKLMVRVDARSYPTQDARTVSSVTPLKMVCRGPSPDSLHTQLARAIQGQAWAAAPPGLLQQLCPAPTLPPSAGGAVPGRYAPGPLGQSLPPWAAAAPAAPTAAASAAGSNGFQPNWAIVEGLCAASFSRLHAVNAVVATQNAGVQQAVEWILDHQDSPALDHPSPYLQGTGGSVPSSSSSSALPPSGSGAQQLAYPAWPPVQPPPVAQGSSSFSNPLLAGQSGAGGSGAWDGLGGSSGSWELLERPGDSSGSGLYGTSSGLYGSSSGGTMYGSGTVGASSAAALSPARQGPAASGAGVALILKREEQKVAATESAIDSAFRDLDQLMRQAGEMVQLAQYFKERVAARKEGAGGDGGEEELDAETALDLLNLGIVSPVTRETAGSLYHQELSRQLADFLRVPMERASGMMPLPDIYCLYNRARGTELISPDDLLTAIKLFPKIRAPYALREFASGIKVVQAASHSDDAVCRRLAEMVAPQPQAQQQAHTATIASATAGAGGVAAGEAAVQQAGPAASSAAAMQAEADVALLATLGPAITRTEVAVALGVPVPVAGEHLRMAEARGVLCRDDGPEGLRYFRNFFADPELTAAAAPAS